jgi:hypothetical protein
MVVTEKGMFYSVDIDMDKGGEIKKHQEPINFL